MCGVFIASLSPDAAETCRTGPKGETIRKAMIAQTRFVSQLLTLVVLGLPLAAGCGGSASANASAKASTKGEADANFDVEGESAWDQQSNPDGSGPKANSDSASSAPVGQAPVPAEVPLLGARHDLLLAEGAPKSCQCLAVVLGQPALQALIWTGRRPTTDPNSQLVIALSSDGVSCPKAGPGASYMGYRKQDGNVIVTVEAAVSGRPVTQGAIIPRPDSGKQVLVEPNGDIPYGRGLGGEAQCSLGVGH